MKRLKTKQIITCLLGMLVCKISFVGCYPVIPAYFAAVYLQDIGRLTVTFFLYLGMLIFLPITQIAKYAMAVLVTMVVIRLSEWMNKSCPAWVASMAAGVSTGILSAFGGVLNWKNQISPYTGILEGTFIFGLSMVLVRILYIFYRDRGRKKEKAIKKQRVQREEKLRGYAESFQGLAKVFSSMNGNDREYVREEYHRMQQEITGKVCSSCSQCAVCWEREKSPMQQYFEELVLAIKKWGIPPEEQKKKLSEYCPYTNEVIEEALHVFEKAQLNVAWYNRLQENREVIAQQLDAMAFIMEDCAMPPEDISKKEAKILQEIQFQARERGIVVHDGAVYEKKDGHKQLVLEVSVKKDGCIPVKELMKAIYVATKQKVQPRKDEKSLIKKERMRLVFEEDTMYHTIHGVARLVKEGATVSGDNFSFLELDQGEVVLSLSDGMGSGNRACKESEMVIELIEKFLEAGFSKETAIRMMNSAMVIRGEDDLFSTIDISALNLYDGSCTFYKIGASTTFIKHMDRVECLKSDTLPVGVYHKVDMEKTQRKMENGDFIIMVTDGVLDHLHVKKPEETMQQIIESIETNHPGQMAKRILERVMLFTGGRVEDDMTVMAAAIWEKA